MNQQLSRIEQKNSQPDAKSCSRCGQVKPLEAFAKLAQSKDGLQYSCKDCSKAWYQKQIAINPDYAKEQSQRFYKNNPVAARLRVRRYAERNPAKVRACQKSWYDANAETLRAAGRKAYADNIEQNRIKAVKDWWKHRERRLQLARARRSTEEIRIKEREQAKNWRKANPEKVKAQTQNRRALLKSIEGSFTSADVKKIYANQDSLCFWCGQKLPGKFDVDHIFPISKGGTNFPSNLCCSCEFCNASKGNKTPDEFLKYLKDTGRVK